MKIRIARAVCCILITCLGLAPALASAEMIGIGSVLAGAQTTDARARVRNFVARDEVRQQLRQMGVSDAAALGRVQALTDAEAASLAGNVDQLPAGGVSIAAVLVFFVLSQLIIYYWVP